VAEGYTNVQIAEELQLDITTIETYRAGFAEEMGLASRSDVVRFALELGLLTAAKQTTP